MKSDMFLCMTKGLLFFLCIRNTVSSNVKIYTVQMMHVGVFAHFGGVLHFTFLYSKHYYTSFLLHFPVHHKQHQHNKKLLTSKEHYEGGIHTNYFN